MNWKPRAAQLASEVTHPVSRWRPAVAAVPRHVFAPRWWAQAQPSPGLWHHTWQVRDGHADPARWLDAAYANRSLITQVAEAHADHAEPGDRPTGRPTSSATLPGLLVQMYRHAMISDGMTVLDVGTGTGYGTALLATRLGDDRVTSIDVDAYLVKTAGERLASIGLNPVMQTGDATGPLPGSPDGYDRIIATVAVRPVPQAGWPRSGQAAGSSRPSPEPTSSSPPTRPRTAARPAAPSGTAGFMRSRTGPGYPPAMLNHLTRIRDADGDEVTTGRYPVVNVSDGWELYSTLGLILPGVEDHYEENPDGSRTAWLLHPDGSWARATATADQPPVVHQSGPRRLWNTLDALRADWLRDGRTRLRGQRHHQPRRKPPLPARTLDRQHPRQLTRPAAPPPRYRAGRRHRQSQPPKAKPKDRIYAERRNGDHPRARKAAPRASPPHAARCQVKINQATRQEEKGRAYRGWVRTRSPNPRPPSSESPEPVKETRLDRTRPTRGRQARHPPQPREPTAPATAEGGARSAPQTPARHSPAPGHRPAPATAPDPSPPQAPHPAGPPRPRAGIPWPARPRPPRPPHPRTKARPAPKPGTARQNPRPGRKRQSAESGQSQEPPPDESDITPKQVRNSPRTMSGPIFE